MMAIPKGSTRVVVYDGQRSGLIRILRICLITAWLLSSQGVVIVAAGVQSNEKIRLVTTGKDEWSHLASIRGGGSMSRSNKPAARTQSGTNKKKNRTGKKKRRRKTDEHDNSTIASANAKKNSAAVSKGLQEKDAAQALGDAIRDRADQLLEEKETQRPQSSMKATAILNSVHSVGLAMGASDHHANDNEDESGGVQASATSVIVHYFLKSHGGAHALQCACSLLSVMAGLGSNLLVWHTERRTLQTILLKRCLLFAMIKHVAGLFAGSFLAGQGIPLTGFRQSRKSMEKLATDPVSQYVFYCATLLLWLPRTKTNIKDLAKLNGPEWWQAYTMIPILISGPVLLRELVSTALVVSDVLVLTVCSSSDNKGMATAWIKPILEISKGVINAFMSLLVTPTVWRSACAADRQAILAKIVSRLSLAIEVVVGALLVSDFFYSAAAYFFGIGSSLKFAKVIKQFICARLYLQFLWTRRRKIKNLATTVRGGASHVPLYVLSVLTDPKASMGLTSNDATNDRGADRSHSWTWQDYLKIIAGFD